MFFFYSLCFSFIFCFSAMSTKNFSHRSTIETKVENLLEEAANTDSLNDAQTHIRNGLNKLNFSLSEGRNKNFFDATKEMFAIFSDNTRRILLREQGITSILEKKLELMEQGEISKRITKVALNFISLLAQEKERTKGSVGQDMRSQENDENIDRSNFTH